MAAIDYARVVRPLLLTAQECGDTSFIREHDGKCFLALVDVLGHGRDARDVAVLADAYLAEHYTESLGSILAGLHEALRGTRGAVAAVCRLDVQTGQLRHAGIGNICVRTFGLQNHRFVPRDGIVGYMMGTPREETAVLRSGDLVVMHSDGVKEHADLLECPGIRHEPTLQIAEAFVDRYGKGDDDASCIVLRYLR